MQTPANYKSAALYPETALKKSLARLARRLSDGTQIVGYHQRRTRVT